LPHDEWMDSKQGRILHTDRHNRSVARNTGAAVALGSYLHFLDDDDWILPGAFHHLYEKSKNHEAGWIYGGFQLVNNAGELLHQFQPVETGNCFIQMIASEWIPLQASWINSQAFFGVGGFASLNSLGGGAEDIDLSRLVARLYNFARTSGTVAVIRYGDESSTTDYSNLVNQNRQSREKSLDAPGAFHRMMKSAGASAVRQNYWYGRVAYFYLVSIPWNFRRKRFMKAASRFIFVLLSFALSIHRIFLLEFWRGALLPHHNLVRTTLAGMDSQLYSKTAWRR
jgi:glycosyltransferase involved in cell wall biosynthesis